MRTAPVLLKYAAFVRLAAGRARREPAEMYGRMVFFGVVLGVFSSLWRAVAEAGMPTAADPGLLVWYLAVTEWIVLSAPPIHVDMQEAIRRGDVACQLCRPMSFAGAALAEGFGVLVIRMAGLGATAFSCAWLFAGFVPPFDAFLRAVPFAVISAGLLTTLHACMGLLAFWLEDVTPVYWVWQKLLFVLGGLMMPLELYPAIIQRMAVWTPFPSMLAGPASFMLGDAGSLALAIALTLWWSAALGSLHLVSQRMTSALTINGG